MSKGIFFRLVITLVVSCLVGTQGLYAQDVTRYETKAKGPWEQASTWEIVTRDSQGNVVSRQDASVPPRPSDDVVVGHPIVVNNQTKEIGSLTVTGSGLITGESAATDISIEVESDIKIESGGQISTTVTSKEWLISTGSIRLSSNNGNVVVNGIIETGNGLNAPNTANAGGLSGNIHISAYPNGIIVIGNKARLVTGHGGNGAESDVDGVDATNGGSSGNILLEARRVEQLGSVLTGDGGDGGDAGANGGGGGNAGGSGSVTIIANETTLNGLVLTGNGGHGGNSKANNKDAGDGGNSGNIIVFGTELDEAIVTVDNSKIKQGQGGAGGSAKGLDASAGTNGIQGADDVFNACPFIRGKIYNILLDEQESGLEGALCSLESQSDIIINGLHEEAIVGEFGVIVSAPGIIDLTDIQAGKNMIISPLGEIVFHVSDADNIWLAPGMSLAEITEPDAIVIEDLPIAYIVIDDFEDYNDYPPDEVWMTWIDGWADPTNGSRAGYPDVDMIGFHYLEDTIVHGGDWSLPLFYDNSVGLSEITRTLNANWDQYGVDTLTLWYHGVKDNDAEPMYVALNGDAIVINNNPGAALVTEWTQWDIPLQLFTDRGVELDDVVSISIGFGNKVNPIGGGAGHVFLDDIRLYLPVQEAEQN